jgi:nitrite reductase/ring-hydroxylating ferredoxin subunit
MPKLIKIAETKDLTPGQAAAFDLEGQRIALFNVEGTYYAIGDSCTHRGGPLSEGDVQGTKVTCPWHGADFDPVGTSPSRLFLNTKKAAPSLRGAA